jgi:hypothetical protein
MIIFKSKYKMDLKKMNHSKVKKLVLVTTVVILTFSFIPIVNTGIPPFIHDFDSNQRIKYWEESTVSASKEIWFRMLLGYIPEEIENEWFPKNPYEIRLYLNNMQITLQRFAYKNRNFTFQMPYKENGEWVYNEGPWITTTLNAWVWYTVFKPGSLIPGFYTMRMEAWIYGSYGGSEEEGWRIFENKIGPTSWIHGYGPVDHQWIWEQNVIVNP